MVSVTVAAENWTVSPVALYTQSLLRKQTVYRCIHPRLEGRCLALVRTAWPASLGGVSMTQRVSLFPWKGWAGLRRNRHLRETRQTPPGLVSCSSERRWECGGRASSLPCSPPPSSCLSWPSSCGLMIEELVWGGRGSLCCSRGAPHYVVGGDHSPLHWCVSGGPYNSGVRWSRGNFDPSWRSGGREGVLD